HFYPPRNFGAIPEEFADYQKARTAILPVPYDSTSTFKAGSREGPGAILETSQYLELFDIDVRRETYKTGIHALLDVEPDMRGPRETVDRIRDIARSVLADGKFLVTLGGEHLVSLGPVEAYVERFPKLSVMHLDAHADLHDEYLSTPYNHASVIRRIHECCPVVSAGLRTMCEDEWEYTQQHDLRPIWAERIVRGDKTWIDEAIERLTDDVYLTIDLDAFDPSIMAATGTPEPGGIGWYDALDLIRALTARKRVVGFDVTELCPAEGPTACSFLASKLVYKTIGLVAQANGWPEITADQPAATR
ncbi:MAG: agmatinase, partial [Thermomicrobiales bacterium]|nr:agmatinase [Thermomicrobiales bacterium]